MPVHTHLLGTNWFTNALDESAVVNVQTDYYDAASAPSPDLANGTDIPFAVGGSTDLIAVFDGSPGALKYAAGGFDERVRWIFTNISRILPFEFELEIKDYDWPANTLVNTFTETITCADDVTYVLTPPADTYREVSAITAFTCPA